jgi:hypothetical protein
MSPAIALLNKAPGLKKPPKQFRLATPLTMAERVKTPYGALNITLASYAESGLMWVQLVSNEANAQKQLFDGAPAATLSVDIAKPVNLAPGEFVARCAHPSLKKSLLQSGLLESTGKELPEGEIWRLTGLALLEFMATLAPPITASRASFPAHLFGHKPYTTEAKKKLIAEFEENGYTKHSPSGASIWVVREYCVLNRIPFVIYFIKQDKKVLAARVCRADLAKQSLQADHKLDQTAEIVYESPRAAGSLVDPG